MGENAVHRDFHQKDSQKSARPAANLNKNYLSWRIQRIKNRRCGRL